MTDRSREGLLSFLDWMGEKGLVPLNTAQTRKASTNKVLAILEPEEALDVTQLNIDEIMARFVNLNRTGYSPGSLKTYKSRVTTAITDFGNYLDDPLGFKPSGLAKAKQQGAKTDGSKNATIAKATRKTRPQPSAPPTPMSTQVPANILPIPIRADLTVRVQGLPFDLTQAEARRIANVVLAMAVED